MTRSIPQITPLDKPAQPNAYGLSDSPIGFMLVAWQDNFLVRLTLLPAHTENNVTPFLKDFGYDPKNMAQDDERAYELVQNGIFVNGKWRGLVPATTQLAFHGTEFQHNIMKAMLAIPFGETRAYGDLDMAARAVGTVCAQNPLPFVVPCHRVTAANDTGNYGYGTVLKEQLLRWEAK
jgi:O-6-methylguanine DNA methyltransferase